MSHRVSSHEPISETLSTHDNSVVIEGSEHNGYSESNERGAQVPAAQGSDSTPLMGETLSEEKKQDDLSSYDDMEVKERKGAGFLYQLFATIKRALILMIRQPCSYVCELVIPIIFVCGSIIMWAVFGNDRFADRNYFSDAGVATSSLLYSSIANYLCYDDSSVGPIGTLQACSAIAPDPNVQLYCASSITGAPEGLCGLSSGVALSYTGWVNIVSSNTTVLPSIDEMILLQWLNRLYYEAVDLDTVWDKTEESAIFSSGKLYFSPNTAEVSSLVDYISGTSTYFQYINGGIMSVEEAENTVKARTNKEPPNWGIIQVDKMSTSDFNVSIRLNASALPRTKRSLVKNYVGGLEEDGTNLYILSGFSTLQKLVYDFYLTTVNPGVGVTPSVNALFVPMPTISYDEQKFLANAAQLAPLIIVLGFLYPVSQMTKRIVVEKELRLREAMLIMGLTETVMYLSWFIIYVVQFAVITLIMTILLKVTYVKYSNFGIIFFMLFFFSLSLITLSGLIASFFSKARLAAILSPLIYFVLSIPLFAMQDAGGGARLGISFLSPSGLSVAIDILFDHELSGGMSGSDLDYFRDDPTMLVILIVLFCDMLIYLVLMLYFDAILPKDWGTRKNPLFFILDPINYCRRKNRVYEENVRDGRAEDGVFEPETNPESAAIRIVGLRKEFGRGKKKFVAVKDLHWSMRQGEISVLLGHNGAGKSTTMNMMTGMIQANDGDCYIYGKSIRRDLKGARQEIGFCPQHNILWPKMTCYEHLWYYASIKGLRKEDREEAIDRLLAAVDFEEKRNYRSADLSGGQKRKLSVAIAFVGGSRLVFLDEPTAGMDVGARRHTWGLLREMSTRHSILLSTHFMDEADLLGDTVAIMSHGCLQCSGSNLFLKSKLGAGYVLTMSVKAHAERGPIENMVRNFVPGAEGLGTGAGEVAFRLPMDAKQHFPDLLAVIESDEAKKLGINAYSMSATTLEEIFLKIALADEEKRKREEKEEWERKQNTEEAQGSKDAGDDTEHGESHGEGEQTVWDVGLMTKETSLLWSQFKALMLKRFWNVLRDRRTQFFQIICPVVCVLLAMLLMLVKIFQSPPIILDSNLYGAEVEVDIGGCSFAYPFSSQAFTYDTGFPSGADLSSYLLQTYSNHALKEERYEALSCSDTTYGLPVLFYNNSALHSTGIVLYNLYNGLFTTAAGSDSFNLVTVVDPMPKTEKEEQVNDAIYAMMIGIIIMIPFTFIPSTFVSWIVKEKECKARHLQSVSGMFFSMYWLTNFLFDFCCYVITVILVLIVFVIFNRKEYIGSDTIGATILVFLLYGLSGIAMAYALSFAFNEHSTAQNVVMLGNFIAGFLLVLCISMLRLLKSTEDVANVLRWIFRIVPSYCVGEGICNLAILKMETALGTDKTAFSMNVTGWPIIYMAIELPFYVFITLFIDHPSRRQRSQRLFHNPDAEPEEIPEMDEDVAQEEKEVLEGEERASDLVSVKHLRKVYQNGKVAVRNITFGVKPGEVFGFLGTNGAGKTTTISILCQEFYPTSGYASICGNDIVEKSRQALRYIGYCPQFDATIDLLTPEEHLKLYAGVRGVPYEKRKNVVEHLLNLCELAPYRKTLAHRLSGGNRRKLSVAIALIGGPRVVFLDEPSAGMDPVARRGLWTAVETVADNCSVVLTTHHLEEVEALAHRVAIMVDGGLKCIGDKTHLKHKFGTGFEVNLRISRDDVKLKGDVEKFFNDNFEGCRLREYRARRFTYELPGNTKLSETFKLLEQNNEDLCISDYNVSQTSIEQVFLQISQEAERRQEEEHEEMIAAKKGCCACCTCCN